MFGPEHSIIKFILNLNMEVKLPGEPNLGNAENSRMKQSLKKP